jgi:uncharacterized protein YjbJ (UPF0337 family)
MNSDQLKGKWAQFRGELKVKWARFTEDDLKEVEGDFEKFAGKAQERYGDQKEAVLKWADQWHRHSEKKTAEPVASKRR